MNLLGQFRERLRLRRQDPSRPSALAFLGPGLLVTVGFIDPGNWASNVAAGASFGYALLWVVTLSTVMLILLQHNAAHLGIVTGLCMSEAATRYLPAWVSRPALGTAVLAAVATAFAEIMGGAIALQMLFRLPIPLGATLTMGVTALLLLGNSYRRIEKFVIGFVSLIGLGFLFELFLVKTHWTAAVVGWTLPRFPAGSVGLIMSILGAVVMPHNLFLHSEFIQSRQWNLQGEPAVKEHLRFEFFDTLFSMVVGWAINSAMILLAAATFFRHKIAVDSLEQAEAMLRPILGPAAASVFALALLCAGLASTLTAGMAGGSIFTGLFDRPYDASEGRSQLGVALTLGGGWLACLLVTNTFKALLLSQVLLSVQLPISIVLLVHLTSSRRVMGTHANPPWTRGVLWVVAAIVIALNLLLLHSVLF